VFLHLAGRSPLQGSAAKDEPPGGGMISTSNRNAGRTKP